MSASTVKLLHVEDDVMEQQVIAHHLKAMPEFAFAVTAVPSEDAALAAFAAGGFDLVLLDYQLAQGDGLHLLRRLRQQDPILPIIAVSGVATADVAADLVQAGADDYLHKLSLTSANLAKSVRAALFRADSVRKRTRPAEADSPGPLDAPLLELCRSFARQVGPELLRQLDALELQARQAATSALDLERVYERVCRQLDAAGTAGSVPTRLLLRPLMLELFVRVLGDMPGQAAADAGRAP